MISLVVLALLFGVVVTATALTESRVPPGVMAAIIVGLIILGIVRIIEMAEDA